jgi:hypothetical protein
VRQIAPFVDGIYTLRAKAKRGMYPGGRRVRMKRAVWFGGLTFYWAKVAIRSGHFVEGLKLLFTSWWMILLAVIRRSVAWSSGRKPVEVLSLEPNASENPVGSHPHASTEHS